MVISDLTEMEAKVLNKVARRAKMDWFSVKETNNTLKVYDYERGKFCRNQSTPIKQMVDGLTEHDVETLTPSEVNTFLYLMLKIAK